MSIFFLTYQEHFVTRPVLFSQTSISLAAPTVSYTRLSIIELGRSVPYSSLTAELDLVSSVVFTSFSDTQSTSHYVLCSSRYEYLHSYCEVDEQAASKVIASQKTCSSS